MKFDFKLKLNVDKTIWLMAIIAIIAIATLVYWWFGGNQFEFTNSNQVNKNSQLSGVSSLSGINCDNYNRRPVAVMMSGDTIARPLSGISSADLVFEMPVAPNNITRMMAVFQCNDPTEIGSIRSAREDFIPLVLGLNAVYAHWGGEHNALQKLDSGVANNVDGLKYEGTIYYRKKGINPPHNGFAKLKDILDQAGKLGYELKDNFAGYPRSGSNESKSISNIADTVSVDYLYPVHWNYDQASNTYKRFRDGKPEIDRNNNDQVSASVVIVMETGGHVLNKDYISVATQGSNRAEIYQNGIVVNGKWKKDLASESSKLYFVDNKDKEIALTPGRIWIEISAAIK